MKILIFGAGPIGLLYGHLLHGAGLEVTILARGRNFDRISGGGITLEDGFTGERSVLGAPVVEQLEEDADYDLAIVAVRQNKIPGVLESLRPCRRVGNFLFLGNNVLGFEAYERALEREKIVFGFPGAGGGWDGNNLKFVDREKPGGKRMPIRIGETDGIERTRTREIREVFERAGIPVEIVKDIDGWLKYHAAFVIPICHGLARHGGDPAAVAKDKETLRTVVRACKEGGNVLRALGYRKRQPFKFNLFYWMPELVTAKIFSGIFSGEYAEVAYALHARSAGDEFEQLSAEFRTLAVKAEVETPNFDLLSGGGGGVVRQ